MHLELTDMGDVGCIADQVQEFDVCLNDVVLLPFLQKQAGSLTSHWTTPVFPFLCPVPVPVLNEELPEDEDVIEATYVSDEENLLENVIKIMVEKVREKERVRCLLMGKEQPQRL